MAESLKSTDWASIVRHYDLLMRHFPSPVVRLNRAVAIGQLGRVDEALAELRAMDQQAVLEEYPLLHCALADLLVKTGEPAAALLHLRRALVHIHVPRERELIEQRAAEIQSGS